MLQFILISSKCTKLSPLSLSKNKQTNKNKQQKSKFLNAMSAKVQVRHPYKNCFIGLSWSFEIYKNTFDRNETDIPIQKKIS